MSHHIYQTEGFIIGSMPVNEASRYISIFTEDLGLIRGLAQGVRNNRSKLRYSLQDLSYSKVSFVRGREIWRIVNAEKMSLLENSILNNEKKVFIAKTAAFLKRFIVGDIKDSQLFTEIKNGFQFLNNETLTSEDLIRVELMFVLRILKHLGYGPMEKDFDSILFFLEWDRSALCFIENKKDKVLSAIRHAIAQSHL